MLKVRVCPYIIRIQLSKDKYIKNSYKDKWNKKKEGRMNKKLGIRSDKDNYQKNQKKNQINIMLIIMKH